MRHSSCRFAEPGPYQRPEFVTAPALQRTASRRATRCAASGELDGWPRRPGLARLAVKGRTAMMSQEQNDLITRTGPKDACGKLMRMYWQAAGLVDELQGPRAVQAIQLLGGNLVLFRDEQGRTGLIDRHCAHRGADLAFGRLENGGLRCAFHGWLVDVFGQCLEKPAAPKGTDTF